MHQKHDSCRLHCGSEGGFVTNLRNLEIRGVKFHLKPNFWRIFASNWKQRDTSFDTASSVMPATVFFGLMAPPWLRPSHAKSASHILPPSLSHDGVRSPMIWQGQKRHALCSLRLGLCVWKVACLSLSLMYSCRVGNLTSNTEGRWGTHWPTN